MNILNLASHVAVCFQRFSRLADSLGSDNKGVPHSQTFLDLSSNDPVVSIGNGVIGSIPNVAHSRISKMEEELKCPVCLDFFKSPVRMTPCGHNYCQECLTGIGLGCPRD